MSEGRERVEVFMSGLRSSTPRWAALLAILWVAGWACDDEAPAVTDMALLPIPDQTVTVSDELQVSLTVINTGGTTPQFSVTSDTLPDLMTRSNRVYFAPFGAGAIMRWTPVVADVGEHLIGVEARTSAGTVSGAFYATVLPGKSAPIFIKPLGSGTTLDLADERCVLVETMVEDYDSPMVRISLDPPVEDNYVFEMTGPSSGVFDFCPSEEQISKSDVYNVSFAADDQDGHLTRKKYVIVLRRSVGQDCQGQAPTIEHAPPGAQSTRGEITFTAEISDDVGVEGDPKLYYSLDTQSWARGIDVSLFTGVSMQRVAGTPTNGTYQAALKSPVETDDLGVSRSIYYFLEVTDNDDMAGNCDNRATVPEGDVFAVEVVAPERGVGLPNCGECARDADCQSGLCVEVGGRNHCVRGCATASSQACGSLTAAGCCEGNILRYCDEGRVAQINCADRPACGWNARRGTYYCQTNGAAEPSGEVPQACTFFGCPMGSSCTDGAATSIDGVEAFVCVPDSGECEAGVQPDPGPDPGTVCIDDAYEDNDTIMGGQMEIAPGEYSNLRLCSDGMVNDDDYYPIRVDDATQLTVQLSFSHAEGDVDVSLRSEVGTALIAGVSVTDDEEISTCLAEGLYYINVWSVDRAINTAYGMSIGLGGCCLDDPRETEGDDTSDRATAVISGEEMRDGQICENDEDWFSIGLADGDTLVIFLKFQHVQPEDDLDVYVLGADLMIAARGDSVTSHENVQFTAPATGIYYIRVLGHMGATNDYQIRFDIADDE